MPGKPEHPISQLTTGELGRYRRELEHAVIKLAGAPVVAELRAKLGEIEAEERARESLRGAVTPDRPAGRTAHHSS